MPAQLAIPAAPTGNRFAVSSADNNAAPIYIATILSLSFAFFILAIRLLLVKRGAHGPDDAVLSLAHIAAVGQWTAALLACKNGLGKSLHLVDPSNQSRMAQATFATRILTIAALCLSKCSVLLFTRMLFTRDMKRQWLVSNIALGTVAAWGLAGVLFLSIHCDPRSILGKDDAKCPYHSLRITVVMALDMLTEVAVTILPSIFLIRVNMTWTRKFVVFIAFSFRLASIAFSIPYLLASITFINKHQSGTEVVPWVVWQQVLLGYSLMSCTIPCLKGFVQSFTTGGLGYMHGRKSSGKSNDNSYELSALSRRTDNSTLEHSAIAFEPMPARVGTGDDEARHEASSITTHGSQTFIIRQPG